MKSFLIQNHYCLKITVIIINKNKMTNSTRNKLIENSISIALTQIFTYVIPLITLPYLSRILDVKKFGLVFWAQACIVYFIIIIDYGFNWSATREIAVNKDNQNKISEIFNSVMGVKFILIGLCFIILNFMIILIPNCQNEFLLFYLTFFMVIGHALYPIWYFQGIEHMKYVTFLKIVSQIIFIILIFLFIKSPNDYIYVALFNSLGFIIAGILSIAIAIKRFNLKLQIPKLSNIKSQFKYSFGYFSANISNTAYTNTNAFILGLIATPMFVGYYVAAEKIFRAVDLLSWPLISAFYPYMAKTKNVKLYKKVFYLTYLTFIIIVLFIFIFAKTIVIIFYGNEMIEAYKILRIFCITMLFTQISGFMGYPFLGALGYSNIVNNSVPIAAFIQIMLLSILYILGKLNIWTISYLTILPYAIMSIIRINGIIKNKLWNYKEN